MNFMSGRTGSRGMPVVLSSSLHQLTHHHHDGGAQLPGYSSVTNGDEFSQLGGTVSAAAYAVIEREHMFDKVVTPSDVGKLNRLVIPKQHAEKYFPLDSSTNKKGLLLNFEDRNGKPWRFRYSYWNSSQSYVMTKGWSRFVKEKKLDAGDIVSFQRGIGEVGKDFLFIDWRRRPDAPEFPLLSLPHKFSFHRSIHPWSHPLLMQPPPPREYSHFLQTNAAAIAAQHHHCHYPTNHSHNGTTSHVVNGNPFPPEPIFYLRSAPAGTHHEMERIVFESVPAVQSKAAAKRLRLFGVNMDCPISDSDECVISSHSTMPLQPLPHPHFHDSSSSSTVPFLQSRPPYDHNDDKGKNSLDLDICLSPQTD